MDPSEAELSNSKQHPAEFSSYAADKFGLKGSKCLVTGGTKGIGRSIVEEFCRLGAEVFTCARNAEDVDRSRVEWAAQGFNVKVAVCDVSKRQECEEFFKQVTTAFEGQLNILVHNAGTNIRKDVLEYTAEDYYQIMGVNLEAAFVLSQMAYPLLKASGRGSIVYISSVAGGPTANRAGPIYASSKAAVNQMARNLALTWASDGIRVNAVAPWVTLTELGKQNLQDKEAAARVLARTPLGKLANPEDVAGSVAFLCSPAASFITGHTLPVDGGYSVMGFW